MKYYLDLIRDRDPEPHVGYRYHVWTPASVGEFWRTFANCSILREQFYPTAYWEDLLAWASTIIRTQPRDVLDVGCGAGRMIECLLRRFPGARVVGTDIAEETLKAVRAMVGPVGRLELRIGRFPHLPVEEAGVDFVVCTEVLEHLEPGLFDGAFAEVRRVLKPGGLFLASLPFNERMDMMACPECATVFTPNQHVLFEISRHDVEGRLRSHGLDLVGHFEPIDRREPPQWHRALVKRTLIRWLPRLARRLFFKAGVTAFLAKKA